uniref:Tyr recombinase domain-containing protein n=1 Tax=uncultured Thiotrichaceae bacterium TaxID=298394 RepID=A0A6S6UBV2_9GAMM|nr:MAG: Unknown protein [uncultured Thiotrichaceae bacterium]
MWNAAVKRSGIEHATLNDLRSKATTDAKKQGLNPTKLLGHTDARTSEIYTRQRATIVATPVTMSRKTE